MKDLQKLYSEVLQDAVDLNIECNFVSSVTWNKNLKSTLGRTIKRPEWCGERYDIEISTQLSEDEVSNQCIKNTIMHELLHTCKDCWCHTGKWKILADRVNSSNKGYKISRCSTEETLAKEGVKIRTNDDYKYIIKCEKCGQEVKREKLSASIKHPENYRCGKCGGAFKRIK